MYRKDALNQLREKLQEIGASAMIIPTNDPHFGEYTQDHYKIRAWLSGFTGSAGTLVVTLSNAALWTDSRYFVQAAKQLEGTEIRLMKLKMPETPTISEWLLKQYPTGAKIAIDKSLFSYSEYLGLTKSLAPCSIELVDDSIINSIWIDRPALVYNNIEFMPTEISGENSKSKLERVVDALNMKDYRFAYIVSSCDEVAWLCNIRGTDIEFNALPECYAVVTNSAIHLFANLDSIGDDVKEALLEQKIELHPYNSFESLLKQFPEEIVRICSKDKITVRDYKALDIANAVFVDDPTLGGTINYFKSIKNNWEKAGFEKANLLDGIAWVKLLKFIDDTIAEGTAINEYEIGLKFAQFRAQSEFYRGESFSPIVAFAAAAALPHYSASEDNAQQIGKDNFLLMDTGGQYTFGTTDTTRTIPIGNLNDTQKRHYTLVLKGMIDLSMAKFPKGTRGSQLDILARGPLFNDALMYFHGTGHGIGHYMCVHEGPQSVRMEENPITLAPGMVMSNEPAVYIEGQYGIRTENVVLVYEWKYNSINDFYAFKTLTLVPIDLSCICKDLLTWQEYDWVRNFNNTVCDTLIPHLDESTAQWLEKKYR